MGKFAHAFSRLVLTVGAGCLVLAGYFFGHFVQHAVGVWEVGRSPVLAAVSICDGRVDPATGECSGAIVVYDAFEQTGATCDGRDAIVSGTLSKVRSDATYAEGRQQIFYGTPEGRSRRTFFEFMDQQQGTPTNRPPGVQDWGPWRLIGGCVTEYATWFSTVEHRPWHGLWPLPTVSGPFPLPRAVID